jgi:soluble lytic murein transglycosylase-like protein/tetratricopeptide (TPR) repeat protein
VVARSRLFPVIIAVFIVATLPAYAGTGFVAQEIEARFARLGKRIPKSPPTDLTDSFESFLIGVYHLESGKLDEALAFLERANEDAEFALPEYMRFYLGRAYLEKGDLKRGKELLNGVLDLPSSPVGGEAGLLLMRTYLTDGDLNAATALWAKLELVVRAAQKRAEILLHLETALVAAKDYRRAFEIYLDGLPALRGASTDERRQYDALVRLKFKAYQNLPPKDQEKHRRTMYHLAESAVIRDIQRTLLDAFPAGVWKFWEEGRLATAARKYQDARKLLEKALGLSKSEDEKARIKSDLARVYARLSQPDRAIKALDDYAKVAPDEALFRKADYLSSLDRRDEAQSMMTQLVKKYPTSSYAGRAHMWLFQYHMNAGKPADAVNAVAEAKDPDYLPVIRYWRAHLAGTADEGKLLVQESPYSFYAVRYFDEKSLEDQSLVSPLDVLLQKAGTAVVPGSWESRVSFLMKEGLYTWTFQELALVNALGNPGPRALYYMASVYGDLRNYALSVRFAERVLSSRDYSMFTNEEMRQILRLAFPLAYQDIVRREAEKNGLDPLLVLALIRQESMFDPGAVSSARAIGLMQVIPPTARSIAKKVKTTTSTAKLKNPEHNVHLGVWYLKHLIDLQSGSLVLALASYNWGASRVARYTSTLSDDIKKEEVALIDLIPIGETRLYVKKVLFNYWMYRRIWGDLGS